MNNQEKLGITRHDALYLLLMNPVQTTLPIGLNTSRNNYSTRELQTLVERDVINCQRKTAFISVSENVLAEKDFLDKKYPSKKLYLGRTALETARVGWSFTDVGGVTTSSQVSRVHRNFQVLMSSGIYGKLKKEMAENTFLERQPVVNDTLEVVSPIKIDGRLITIFIPCGVLHCLAFGAILIEGYIYVWGLIVNAYLTCVSLLVKLNRLCHDLVRYLKRMECTQRKCCVVIIFRPKTT